MNAMRQAGGRQAGGRQRVDVRLLSAGTPLQAAAQGRWTTCCHVLLYL